MSGVGHDPGIGGRLGVRSGSNRGRHWVCALFAVWFTGCSTVVPSTTLLPPQQAARTIPSTAWIGEVKISDPDMTRRETMAASLAASLREYVEQGRYFSVVKSLPGKPAPSDYILDFDFSPYRQSRSLLPYYIPAAVLTVTLYIWFGGPIVSDDLDIAGTLTIRRQGGEALAVSRASVKQTARRNVYDDEYLNASTIKERTELIKQLLDQATVSLKGGA